MGRLGRGAGFYDRYIKQCVCAHAVRCPRSKPVGCCSLFINYLLITYFYLFFQLFIYLCVFIKIITIIYSIYYLFICLNILIYCVFILEVSYSFTQY
jgi:hypothetical protein